jgi:hypothetical protein
VAAQHHSKRKLAITSERKNKRVYVAEAATFARRNEFRAAHAARVLVITEAAAVANFSFRIRMPSRPFGSARVPKQIRGPRALPGKREIDKCVTFPLHFAVVNP